MSDYLMREAAPLDAEIWSQIDDMVVSVARQVLVARRFIHMVGPLGWGVEVAPLFGFSSEGGVAVAQDAQYLKLAELSQDFVLKAKQLAIAAATPFGLDLGAVATAATALAKAEDDLILGGLAQSATVGELGDWNVLGGPFAAIAVGTANLLAAGFDAPYALVLSPALYAQLASLMSHGRRELEMVKQIVGAGIFQWTGMPAGQAMVVSPAAWNVDMVVGQDIATAYVGNEGLDQCFRIFETLALRVKRPGAAYLLK